MIQAVALPAGVGVRASIPVLVGTACIADMHLCIHTVPYDE